MTDLLKHCKVMNFISKLRGTKPLVIIISLVSVFILSVVFQGCEKSEFEDKMDYKLEIPEQYNEVGKLHNQGLDHVFNAIREFHLGNMKNADPNMKSEQVMDYNAIITEASIDFCRKNEKMKNHFDVCKSAILSYNERLKSANLNPSKIEGLSSNQQKFIDQIIDAISFKYSLKNIRELKSELDKINRSAAKELVENEAIIIYGMASTAYSSYQYWLRNYNKWYFALHYPEILQQYNDEQLNNLSVKNGELSLKSATDWWDDVWDDVEGSWDSTTDAAVTWWENDGNIIIGTDAGGYVTGALAGMAGAPFTAGASVPATGAAVALIGSAGACVTIMITSN